jgi:hypothetical protein
MAWSDPATRTRSGPAPVPRGRSVPFVSRGDVVERRIENVDQSESGHWYLSWLDRRGASEAGGAPPRGRRRLQCWATTSTMSARM